MSDTGYEIRRGFEAILRNGVLWGQCWPGPVRISRDYDGIVKAVYKGYAARMMRAGPTGLANFFPAAHPYTYDLAKAKSLLAKAGYPHGFPLGVT